MGAFAWLLLGTQAAIAVQDKGHQRGFRSRQLYARSHAHEHTNTAARQRQGIADEERDENLMPPLSLLCLGDETFQRTPGQASAGGVAAPAKASLVESGASLGVTALGVAQGAHGNFGGANVTTPTGQGDHVVQVPRKHWFAFTLTFAFCVKAACMASNIIFSVSPFPQVHEFSKHGHTGVVDCAPFMSILYGGFQWCFYGLFAFLVTKKSGFLVLVYSNVLGAFLGTYYVYGFMMYCRDSGALSRLKRYAQVALVVVTLQVFAIASLSRARSLLLVGFASSVCSVVGSLSLLATLPVVLETRCSKSINLPLATVGFLSGILWLTCGFILWDVWILVPNVANLCLNTITLSCGLYFPQEDSKAGLEYDSDAPEAVCVPSSITRRISSPTLDRGVPILRRSDSLESTTEQDVQDHDDVEEHHAAAVDEETPLLVNSAQHTPITPPVVPNYGSTNLRLLPEFWQRLAWEPPAATAEEATASADNKKWDNWGETGGTM